MRELKDFLGLVLCVGIPALIGFTCQPWLVFTLFAIGLIVLYLCRGGIDGDRRCQVVNTTVVAMFFLFISHALTMAYVHGDVITAWLADTFQTASQIIRHYILR